MTIARRARSLWRLDRHVTRLSGLLALLVIAFAVVKPHSFANVRTWQSMAVQFPEFGLMALGVMIAMLTGGIDLSVVGIANMTGITAAVTMLSIVGSGGSVGVAIATSIAVALLIGAVAGLVNGALIAMAGVPPILATLGTLELFTGVAIVITEGRPISGLPSTYADVFAGKAFGVLPAPLVAFALAAVLLWFLLERTAFGPKLRLLGTNPVAARFSGLETRRLLLRTYLASGVFASMAGLVMLANYNSAKADYGAAYTLLTVLIVVLGGVNPNGGAGRLLGVILAILILQILSSGLNLFPAISNFYRPLIWGGVLLVTIVANHASRRRGSSRTPNRQEPTTP